MVQINMEMPDTCLKCKFMDTNGDYPTCIILDESRGYSFDIGAKRFPNCPLSEIKEKPKFQSINNYIKE